MTVFAMPVYVPDLRVINAAAFAGEEQAEKKINATSCCLFMVVTNPVSHGPTMRNWPLDRGGVSGAVL